MTSEMRALIEPGDIVAIEYDCTHCHVKHLIPVESFDRGTPSACPNCQQPWIHGADEAQTINYFVKCLSEVQGLAQSNTKRGDTMHIRFQVRN